MYNLQKKITEFSGRCNACDNSSKQQDGRNLNNLYDALGEKPPSKKPRRIDNSGDSSALSRRSTFHAGSSSSSNYSSGAPPAPVPQPIPLQDPTQQHRTRPAEHGPGPAPPLPPQSQHQSRPAVHIKIFFNCTYCPAKFGENHNLKRHVLLVHTVVKSFQCSICTSNTSFKTQSELSSHFKRCHTPPPQSNMKVVVANIHQGLVVDFVVC
jgi:hypothetical protein